MGKEWLTCAGKSHLLDEHINIVHRASEGIRFVCHDYWSKTIVKRCGSCRTQTQHFCFIHQEFVCDGCLTAKGSIHGRCVLNTYRKWVQDSTYDWPPHCPACSEELDAEDVEHATCVEKSAPPDHACAICETPLRSSFDDSKLGQAALERVRRMPSLQALLPELSESPQTSVQVPSAKPLKQPLERPNAALQVIETESGTSVSHVAANDVHGRLSQPVRSNAARAPSPPPVQTAAREPPAKPPAETRIDIGIPPLKSKPGNSGSYNKREKSASRAVSASWRRTLKAGNRRLVDLRKLLRENPSRVTVAILFVVCVIMVVYLTSGEDDTSAASHPVVEDVSLPHVRVNPAFVRGPIDPGLARLNERVR